MDPHNVRGYCQQIFKRSSANLDFNQWWNGVDAELGAKPSEACIETPRLVIERAESIIEFEEKVAA